MAYIKGNAINSCGIESIEEIDAPIRVLKGIYSGLTGDIYALPVPAFYVFSDVIGTKNKQSPGQKLAKFIKKNLPNSNITRSCVRKNPNSGNRIAIWTWAPPRNLVSILKRNLK